jgi:transposase
VVRRGELTDEAWAVIAPLLPEPGSSRGRWRDHRQVINGILWKLRTGAPWRDLPERYEPWKTCHECLRRWTADGTDRPPGCQGSAGGRPPTFDKVIYKKAQRRGTLLQPAQAVA